MNLNLKDLLYKKLPHIVLFSTTITKMANKAVVSNQSDVSQISAILRYIYGWKALDKGVLMV